MVFSAKVYTVLRSYSSLEMFTYYGSSSSSFSFTSDSVVSYPSVFSVSSIYFSSLDYYSSVSVSILTGAFSSACSISSYSNSGSYTSDSGQTGSSYFSSLIYGTSLGAYDANFISISAEKAFAPDISKNEIPHFLTSVSLKSRSVPS